MAGKNLYLKTAIDAAALAGAFVLKKMGRFGKIFYKGRINLVTDVDRKSEEIIVRRIKKIFPGHSILGEEGGRYYDDAGSAYKWIIDPLDGTTNYAHSFPVFCVSVALEKNGQVVVGVVYDPVRDEFFWAEKGGRAYLNKKPISVSKIPRLSKALLVTGFSYNVKEAGLANVENFRKFLIFSQAVRRTGSAAIDLCYVACGRFDAFWEAGLHPWDTAAAGLIAETAGARLTDFTGRAYTCYDRHIIASNGRIHNRMLEVIGGTV